MKQIISLMPLILLVVIMYLLLIRPQKKRDKQVNAMRSSVKAGDQIVTIGGIYGTVVKAKDEQLVVQIGADKTKIEIARWAISKVLNEDPAAAGKPQKAPANKAEEEETAKKARPKKLEKVTSTDSVATADTESTTEAVLPEIQNAEVNETTQKDTEE